MNNNDIRLGRMVGPRGRPGQLVCWPSSARSKLAGKPRRGPGRLVVIH